MLDDEDFGDLEDKFYEPVEPAATPDAPGKPMDDMGRADLGRQAAGEQLRAEQKAEDTRKQQIKTQRIANLAKAREARKTKQENKADA